MKKAGKLQVIKVPKLTIRNRNFLGPVGSGSGSGITGTYLSGPCTSEDKLNTSVSDPDSLIPDPNPAFLAEYPSVSRVLMTKILKKLQRKNNLIFF
jgi:hypothetical protein